MRTLAGSADTTLSAGYVGVVQLIEAQFPVPMYLNVSTWDISYGGNVYKSAAGVFTASPITDKGGEIQGMTLEFFADASFTAVALDAGDTVQGTIVKIRTAIIDQDTFQVLDAPLDWLGKIDTMSITENSGKAAVTVTLESKAVDLMRGNPMLYSDPEQRAIAPNDASFSFAASQVGKPVVWPAKEFFNK